MLAYNLSPSFNWDTTGMTDEQMKCFPEELGKLGFVFNFITYGGHQIDGLAAEDFAGSALRQEGMLSLAKLQRKLRLIESALAPPRRWLAVRAWMPHSWRLRGARPRPRPWAKDRRNISIWCKRNSRPRCWRCGWTICRSTNHLPPTFRPQLRPLAAGSDFLELSILHDGKNTAANLIFADMQDRHGQKLLSIRDMNTFDPSLQKKRLMTLAHLFLLHRYKAELVHYLSPTEDNQHQAQKMKRLGIFSKVDTEGQMIIVATVSQARIAELLIPDREALNRLITKQDQPQPVA